MPRDAGGNYTLAAGNPVVAGTIIRPSWANPTMDDLAIEMTDSLSRSGKGGMLVPFLNVDGAVNLPGIAFTSEPSLGFFREGNNEMRAGVAATDSTRWIAGDFGFEIWDGTAWQKPVVPGSAVTGAIVLENNIAIEGKEVGGTARKMLYMDVLDTIVLGNAVSKMDITAASPVRFFVGGALQFQLGDTIHLSNKSMQFPNNFGIVMQQVDLTQRVVAFMNTSDEFRLGSFSNDAFFQYADSITYQDSATFTARFIKRADGSLEVADTVGTFSPVCTLGGADQNFTTSVRFLSGALIFKNNLNISGTPFSDVGTVRILRLNPSDVWEIGQNSSAINGMILNSGQVGTEFTFNVGVNKIAAIEDVGIILEDDMRLSIKDSIGDVKAAIFYQADNEMRIGGTGNPNASIRCGALGFININVGTTVSQQFTEDTLILKSKSVGALNTAKIQLQDFNGLNTGAIGTFGSGELRIQGQGGQDIRLEALAVTFNVIGTSANAANVVFVDADRSIKLSTSARRYKKDIVPIAKNIMQRVLDVSPIRYKSKSKGDDPNQEFYGLTAEDVHAVDPRLVHMVDGKPNGVMYDRVAVLLLGVVKDMAKRLRVLENA